MASLSRVLSTPNVPEHEFLSIRLTAPGVNRGQYARCRQPEDRHRYRVIEHERSETVTSSLSCVCDPVFWLIAVCEKPPAEASHETIRKSGTEWEQFHRHPDLLVDGHHPDEVRALLVSQYTLRRYLPIGARRDGARSGMMRCRSC